MRSLLREFIRDSILLEKKKDCHGDVCIAVSALKSSLQKKHFVVQVVYKQPDPSNRHANFGSLDVRIDTERGRGSNMTQSATAKAIRGAVDSSDVGKFFRTNGATFDGSWVNVGFLLRDKYASDYMQGKKPEESGEDKEADKKPEKAPKEKSKKEKKGEKPVKNRVKKGKKPLKENIASGQNKIPYKGEVIEIRSDNEWWVAELDPAIVGEDEVFAKTPESVVKIAKQLIDITQQKPPEWKKAFEFIGYVALAGPNEGGEWSRPQLARMIETDRKSLQSDDPEGYQTFYNLPIEDRLNIIDIVVEISRNSQT